VKIWCKEVVKKRCKSHHMTADMARRRAGKRARSSVPDRCRPGRRRGPGEGSARGRAPAPRARSPSCPLATRPYRARIEPHLISRSGPPFGSCGQGHTHRRTGDQTPGAGRTAGRVSRRRPPRRPPGAPSRSPAALPAGLRRDPDAPRAGLGAGRRRLRGSRHRAVRDDGGDVVGPGVVLRLGVPALPLRGPVMAPTDARRRRPGTTP
jgi:hypothetical protein